MSLQWTLVASFLYAEIAVLLLFVAPFISARGWNRFFKSRFLQVLSAQATWYFCMILIILTMLLLDAIREMRKYSQTETSEHSHLENELQKSMRLFRAQRNFYISGFALFLCMVIRRFATIIIKQAELEAECEASLKQAKSASAAANTILKGAGEPSEELKKLKVEKEKAEKKILSLEKDKEALISQSKALENEYDRLAVEHKTLELKLKIQPESKKDD